MIDSIFVALSGMLGHERGLNVISNNVTNLNSPGFRGTTLTFSDVFTGAPPSDAQNAQFATQQKTGGGVDASRKSLDMQVGARQPTGRGLDLFLQGDGFFVLQDESGAIRYTRAGNFDFNDGVLVASDLKSKVMARNASGQLVPITLKDLQVSAGKPTTTVTFDGILSEDDSEHTIDSLDIVDKQGNKHTVSLKFSPDSTTPTTPGFKNWKVSVTEDRFEVGSGALEFAANQVAPGSSPLQLTLALTDADPVDVAFDFSAVSSIQRGDNSTVAVQKQDGFAAGTITAKSFDEKGVLKLTYSNGQKVDGPKLVFAQIPDEHGLFELDGALFVYRGTQAINLREAGDDLQVLSGSLEQSNVDLTTEFSQLILMQRGYQASSQVVSTANDMLQELFDMRGRR